jgi:8-oxo-dGTP diphosphatase
VLVIRHARAGKRAEWTGDDRVRPLDDRGLEQAAALVAELVSFPLERILSSPYDRCVQTVEPLAAARGVPIEVVEALAEEHQADAGVALARASAGEPVALCVHGGLSDDAFGVSLKKGETLVVDANRRVVARVRT